MSSGVVIRSPQAALDELIAGNRRFTSGRTISHRRDLVILQEMMEKQEPFAAILSCADSRVPVEVVFDQTIGQLFVTRVAGNMVTPARGRRFPAKSAHFFRISSLRWNRLDRILRPPSARMFCFKPPGCGRIHLCWPN
jgi:hypothetical protein